MTVKSKVSLQVDSQFEALLPPLSSDEAEILEQSLLSSGKCLDTIKVWSGKGIILDGHNRFRICKKHALPYEIELLEFDSRAKAMQWIVNFQCSRRNMTPEAISYYRGQRYIEEKGERGKKHQNDVSTSERLAEEFKVSKPTIERDANYAKAVDRIAETMGEDARRKILSRDIDIKKNQAPRLAQIAVDRPDLAENVINGKIKFEQADKESFRTKRYRSVSTTHSDDLYEAFCVLEDINKFITKLSGKLARCNKLSKSNLQNLREQIDKAKTNLDKLLSA